MLNGRSLARGRISSISHMSTRESRPDVLIIGAPEGRDDRAACGAGPAPADLRLAGQGAEVLHVRRRAAAGVRAGRATRTASGSGSGGADYAALFAAAPADALRLESTPFYLYLAGARRRIAEELPDARLIVVVRDPIDRAYSNWMHLWVDGLEPYRDFVAAWHAEDERVAAGWAPFWHYRRLGRYGEQLPDLLARVDRERVLVLRYWQLVSQPTETLNRVARFLGIAEDQIGTVPPDNSRPFVEPGLRTAVHRPGHPRPARRRASSSRRRSGGRPAGRWSPRCSTGGRDSGRSWPRSSGRRCSADCADDIALLEEVLGESFQDWRSTDRPRLLRRADPVTDCPLLRLSASGTG